MTMIAEVLEILVPLLLDVGLHSTEAAFAVQSLLDICRAARSLLEPQVARIVGVLLQALSTMEPGQFNYLQQHVDSLGVSAEQLESARLSALAGSPLHDTLSLCADHVASSNASAVSIELVKLVKRGVGMQTRVGAAQFIEKICSRDGGKHIRGLSGKLLAALLVAIFDQVSVLDFFLFFFVFFFFLLFH